MKIFIILNSKTQTGILKKGLSVYGYQVDYTDTQSIQIPIATDLIITNVDLCIDNKSIQELIFRYKKRYTNTKILGIFSGLNWEKKVKFLNYVGEDVINYPFPFQELLARIQILLKGIKEVKNKYLEMNSLILLKDEKRAMIDNIELPLRKKEYNLLEYMVINQERSISRDEIIDHIWDYKKINSSNTVDVHINRLRSKLKNSVNIKTIHGFGYKISKNN